MQTLEKNKLLEMIRFEAQQKEEKTGISYKECISYAIDKICKEQKISKKQYIKLFR